MIERALIERIDRARDRHGLSKSGFGEKAVGDPNLYGDLEAGRELRSSTRARVEACLDGLEAAAAPNGHRPGCECEECWQTIYPATAGTRG